MYRIALCEDDSEILRTNTAMTRYILKRVGVDGEIAQFSSGEELLSALEHDSNAFDLLLLDILMGELNGMQLAKELRRRGIRAGIAFITSSEDFLREGYQVQHVNYLLKPVTEEELTEVILTARRMNAASQTVAFRNGTSSIVVEISEIVYIEVCDHKLYVCTASDRKCVSGTLSSVEPLLPRGMFSRCHNSYLVNLAYVREYNRTGVKLRGGGDIPVSRSCFEPFQIDLINYLA